MPGRIIEKVTPPSEVEMIPAGRFVSRDGRVSFDNDDPDAVIAATKAQRMTEGLPIDYEHAIDLAPKGHPAPAAGWIKGLRNRSGAIIAQLEWTTDGATAVSSGEYGLLAPVFAFSKDKVPRVQTLLRAGLTNNPFPGFRAAGVSIGDHAIALVDRSVNSARGISESKTKTGGQRMTAKLTDLERAICANMGISELKYITAAHGRSGDGFDPDRRATHSKRIDQRLSEMERAISSNVGVSASAYLAAKMGGKEALIEAIESNRSEVKPKTNATFGLMRATQKIDDVLNGLDPGWAAHGTTIIAGEAVNALQQWIKAGGDEEDYRLVLQGAVLAVQALAKIMPSFADDDQDADQLN